jgi:site-specific recombinase XerD
VFTVDEVARIIHSADNLKHRTILMLVYSSGLRISELVNLQIHDIVRNSMRIRVRNAKGGKDRYTIFAHRCLQQLELYWKTYRPPHWLFCGRNPGNHISIRAVQ